MAAAILPSSSPHNRTSILPPLRVSSFGRCGRDTQAHQKEDKMAIRPQTRPTAEQRDARRRDSSSNSTRRQALSSQAKAGSVGFASRSRFHRYSLRNTLLIAFQCPHATHVAGFRRWLELGRGVRKGEKAIRILAPRSLLKARRPDRRQREAASLSR